MQPLLHSLRLVNFRNHRDYSITFSPVTIITGANGSGKTSILEAISYISVATSWKTERDAEVICWDEGFCRVIGGATVEHELALQRSPSYKRLRIDGISKRLKDVLGELPTVLFQPDDSMILYGAPAYRRQLLDRLLSQTESGYAPQLQQYQKVLKQRNKLLKRVQEGLAGAAELDYWDVQLAEAATIIQDAREKFVTYLQENLPQRFAELMPGTEPVSVHYQRSPESEELLAKLRQSREKEIAAGSTLYGPHREDLLFLYGKVSADTAVSRGQGRALVVALKLLEVAYIESVTEKRAILLLDDIFSEFDEERQVQLLALLPSHQTILTTTHIDALRAKIPTEFSEVNLS